MFVILIPLLQLLHLLLKRLRARRQFKFPFRPRLQVCIRRHIIRQLRDTEITINNLQCPRRKTGLQVTMQLSEAGEVLVKQHERQVRLPPHIRIGTDQGMRSIVIGLTQRFQVVAGLRTFPRLQLRPHHPV